MQRVNFVGRWRGVHIDGKCPNFYPSSTFKAGAKAVRRIPLTRGKFALVDAGDYYRLSKFHWMANKGSNTFYASRTGNRKKLMMHRVIMNPPGHLFVDHIDHNGLNNCRSNLRLCTPAQNRCNLISKKGNSKYKGVHWKSSRKKWAAAIQLNRKIYHIGHFTDEIAAARAYDERAKQLHGEFACLNFPPEK
ncbi:MAG: HNH endonuclease [Deltaproteobacteria bacterium]|nr:HNH endonuclease [Deltaproteobacteria bacterium]